MAEHEPTPAGLDGEIVQKMTASLDGLAAVPQISLGSSAGGGDSARPVWPDGNGKHRHPKDHFSNPGRSSNAAGVNAVHRTSRPQMPHSH